MSERTYKIGEAAQLLNLKSYVLRFWESEFPQLRPTRTESGQRLYTERNLDLLRRIRHLLHDRGLTIEGARKILSDLEFAADEGLSSELLDEGYQDFFADLGIEDEANRRLADVKTQGAAGVLPEDDSSFLEPACNSALLQEVLDELKNIRALFPSSPADSPDNS